MVWDYAETNPFANAEEAWISTARSKKGHGSRVPTSPCRECVSRCSHPDRCSCSRHQLGKHCLSTDPPYYDNVGYADLSDFFYVWLRRSLQPVFPELFATLAVPKAEELVATPYRHGSKEAAESFFLAV